jgi:hypothetical protein
MIFDDIVAGGDQYNVERALYSLSRVRRGPSTPWDASLWRTGAPEENVREHSRPYGIAPRDVSAHMPLAVLSWVGHRVELAAPVVCRIGDETVGRSILSQA